MPYLIFTANGEEYDRRELRGSSPIVIGRAPDCDVPVRDIILSRHHCRIERDADGHWIITDLHSKNGTQYLGHAVERHVLRDGDELRVGRTRLTFKAGAFVPSPNARKRAVVRPVDPSEALAGTVTGMVVCEPGETEKYDQMPFPQPRPTEPKAYMRDGVQDMINDIISSSWDSIQAQASEPTRMQRATPVPAVTKAHRGAIRPKPRVSFALQAQDEHNRSMRLDAPAAPKSMDLRAPGRLHGRPWFIAVTTVAAIVLLTLVWAAMSFGTPASKPDSSRPTPAPQREARHTRAASHDAAKEAQTVNFTLLKMSDE